MYTYANVYVGSRIYQCLEAIKIGNYLSKVEILAKKKLN